MYAIFEGQQISVSIFEDHFFIEKLCWIEGEREQLKSYETREIAYTCRYISGQSLIQS